MSLIDRFNTVTGDGWTTAGMDVQYKVIGDTLYFQCSKGKSDWRNNFRASSEVYKNSDIPFIGHKGFNEMWESVRKEIEQLTFRKICAYSQGCAFGERAHENYYHRFGFEPEVSIFFGGPPSIKRASKKLKERFSNVVNYHNPRDIVYFLPLILGYRHVGKCRTLKGVAKRPSGYKILKWLSGHSEAEYRQRACGDKKKSKFIFFLVASMFALCSCVTSPAVVIDTTDVDTAIIGAMDTAGELEKQTVTIYQTVEKLIYKASPEEKELVRKQFAEKQLSETKLKASINEIARLHGIEIGKLSSELKRLQPFEVESEKQKAQKWRAYALLGILSTVIAAYIAIKVFKVF